jgi:hypothetical protein
MTVQVCLKFKVPTNLDPIDKWMMRNATRVMAYRAIMDMFPDHSKWNFLDEKPIVNRDVQPKKLHWTHSLITPMQFQ